MSEEPKSKLDAAIENYEHKPTVDPAEADRAEMRQFMANAKAKEERDIQKADYEEGIGELISHCREDTEIPLSDRVIRGTLNTLAEENPTFRQAFAERKTNPEAYAEYKDWSKAKVKDELTSNTSAKKVVQASMAAVGHSDNESPQSSRDKTDKEIVKMSDSDFEQYVESQR